MTSVEHPYATLVNLDATSVEDAAMQERPSNKVSSSATAGSRVTMDLLPGEFKDNPTLGILNDIRKMKTMDFDDGEHFKLPHLFSF